MAPRINPSKGAKPDKLLRDALLLELAAPTKDDDGNKINKFRRIAANLVKSGMDSKLDAIKEIWDRVEGRPAQSIGLGQAEDLKPLETIERPPISREVWLSIHSGGKK